MDDLKSNKIIITGGTGFLGTNLYYTLLDKGVPKENIKILGSKTDLRIKENCKIFDKNDIVFHLAATTGGIGKHKTSPAQIVYDNLLMNTNVIDEAAKAGVSKLILVGTACSYPAKAKVPLKEKDIWKGYPAKETAPYGVVKRVMSVQADAYREQYGLSAITIIPTNMYGKYDNFTQSAHVIPALIKKISQAKQTNEKEVLIWGDGTATREFIYAQDVAKALIMAAEKYDKPDPLNIGTGIETPIKDLVHLLTQLIGYEGEIKWDATMPNGTQRRQLDVSKAYKALGFKASTGLEEGLRETIKWYSTREF